MSESLVRTNRDEYLHDGYYQSVGWVGCVYSNGLAFRDQDQRKPKRKALRQCDY